MKKMKQRKRKVKNAKKLAVERYLAIIECLFNVAFQHQKVGRLKEAEY